VLVVPVQQLEAAREGAALAGVSSQLQQPQLPAALLP
jgi:hypothetical protein